MAQAIELSKSILVHAVTAMTSSGNKAGSRGQELLVTVEDESIFVLEASSRLPMDQLLEGGAKNRTKQGSKDSRILLRFPQGRGRNRRLHAYASNSLTPPGRLLEVHSVERKVTEESARHKIGYVDYLPHGKSGALP